jgi:hypothetical protein
MSISNKIYMRNRQVGGGVPNSPAIPLSSAVYGANFRCRRVIEITFKLLIGLLFLRLRGRAPVAGSGFSPAIREKRNLARGHELFKGAEDFRIADGKAANTSVHMSTGALSAIRSIFPVFPAQAGTHISPGYRPSPV